VAQFSISARRRATSKGDRDFLIRQRTLMLWWDTGTHATCEEAEGMQLTATGFVVRAARLLIATLGADQDDTGTLQVTLPMVCVKR
jgi:hypothetical protein